MKFACKMLLVTNLFFFTSLAQAYVGPGAGLSAIGSIIAFVVAIVLMIVGFLWYPIKRLFKGKKADPVQDQLLPKSDSKEADFEQPEK